MLSNVIQLKGEHFPADRAFTAQVGNIGFLQHHCEKTWAIVHCQRLQTVYGVQIIY